MSTPTRPAASDSLIALIQPYVDDVLPPDERARVDAVLAEDPVLREMVDEQCSVRHALQALPRDAAPQALQARVLLELDAIDREQAATPAPRWSFLRAFLRGGAVMVPAGATALALFLVARIGDAPQAEPGASQAGPAAVQAQEAAQTLAAADLAPLDFRPGRALRLGDAPGPSPGVRLVGASIGSPARTADMPELVELRVGSRRVLDRREPAGGPPPGPAHDHRGQRFWLGRVDDQPAVSFEADGLRHTLTRLGPGFADAQEYMFLLSLGHALR